MPITSKEMVDDEFRRYLAAESTNWRVNNVMEWWSTNEGHFPNIAKMALKYLGIQHQVPLLNARVFAVEDNP